MQEYFELVSLTINFVGLPNSDGRRKGSPPPPPPPPPWSAEEGFLQHRNCPWSETENRENDQYLNRTLKYPNNRAVTS